MPDLPIFNDTLTTLRAHEFFSNLIGLVTAPFLSPVPINVDVQMFIIITLGLIHVDFQVMQVVEAHLGKD